MKIKITELEAKIHDLTRSLKVCMAVSAPCPLMHAVLANYSRSSKTTAGISFHNGIVLPSSPHPCIDSHPEQL